MQECNLQVTCALAYLHILLLSSNLCCSEIKDTILARVQHISLHQVLTKFPSPLSCQTSGPLYTNSSILQTSVGLEPGGPRLDTSSPSYYRSLRLSTVVQRFFPIFQVAPNCVLHVLCSSKCDLIISSAYPLFPFVFMLLSTSRYSRFVADTSFGLKFGLCLSHISFAFISLCLV